MEGVSRKPVPSHYNEPDARDTVHTQERPADDAFPPQYDPLAPSSPWRTGIWRRFPWTGYAALIIALCAAAVMIGVLVVSDGQEVSQWPVSPAVYLAVASAVANVLLSFALARGTEIAFWVKALGSKTTVRDLHNTWSFGTSLKDAVLSGKAFNLVALAGISVALAPINGPFLQRASTVSVEQSSRSAFIRVPVARELPLGYTGTIAGRSHNTAFLTSNFSAVVNDYLQQRLFNVSRSGCSGRCKGKMLAAGYKIACAQSFPILNMTPGSNNISTVTRPHEAFGTNFTFDRQNLGGEDSERRYAERLLYSALVKRDVGCTTELKWQKCSLQPALLEQHVLILNNSITLDPDYTYKDDRLIQYNLAFTSGGETSGTGTTHGGMGLILSSMFDSLATVSFSGAVGYFLAAKGRASYQYSIKTFFPLDFNCNFSWSDPTEDMLATARDIAFNAALRAANVSNASDLQNFSVTQEQMVPLYRSNYKFLAVALVFTILSAICVALIFSGFWKLGRDVTLSPIEVAKAFNAPTVVSSDSNSTVNTLMKEVGDRQVRYGVLSDGHFGGTIVRKLAMGDRELISAPEEGGFYGG
ncbi:predicted protein [Uncinocarpus reesii 1704]|uniref:Uncharacterized protein n=1 Tax=Uncinocarpus reesii (strain UAMH 1704) TaxID=336963 RepID=C4JQB1_UNCRE|nr:uncharacterized protein UREG_04665 [Uncinocarpus reesii 1704]EEP79819.1 predicted protein [Uncinocarpus reesii 1704]